MHNGRTGSIAAALVTAALAGAAAHGASVKWVDDATCPKVGSGTSSSPYCSIQKAICSLKSTGGTVSVRPGTYRESLRMFPGVSVVATDGPAVTTIDATGKRCVLSSCLTSTTDTTCSAVVYGSGSTNADRLEGFRITGGAGLARTYEGGEVAVTGGGVFVFNSSPTITRNHITGNRIFSKTTGSFWGGGIYLGGGTFNTPTRPVITSNVIEANSATPTPGTQAPASATYTAGVGGGIYVGVYTAPSIRSNVIRGNRAGDATTWMSGGGGIAVYTVTPGTTTEITGNVIQDNASGEVGGGVAFGRVFDGASDVPTRSRLSNNLIESNRAVTGGGIAASDSRAECLNNTIVDNVAESRGGGISLAGSGVATPSMINNIIAFNSAVAAAGGTASEGGGLALRAEPAEFHHNALFENVPDDVTGAKSAAEYFVVQGNLEVDPEFLSRTPGARDLRLAPTSPLIDAGTGGDASTLDLLGGPRVADGDGDRDAVIDLGAFEYVPPDSDGDGVADPGDVCPAQADTSQLDRDRDGRGDACDLDDDNDWVTDDRDCAPLSAAVAFAPHALGDGLRLDKPGAALLLWTPAHGGLTTNVYRGTIVPGEPWHDAPACLAAGLAGRSAIDADVPPPGSAFYYVLAGRNVCGEGPLGEHGATAELRPAASCPSVAGDADRDAALDGEDNCPGVPNADQADADLDFIGDACDLCAHRPGGCFDGVPGSTPPALDPAGLDAPRLRDLAADETTDPVRDTRL